MVVRTPKKRVASKSKLTRQQLECLSSLVRVDLYEAIQLHGGASIAELAKYLKKSPHSLYHHVSKLLSAKLIRVREYRRVAKRDEAVYEVVSKRLVIDEHDASQEYSRAVVKTVRSALRKADREHSAARLRTADNSKFGLARVQATLTPEDADQLREKVLQLNQWIRRRNIIDDGDAREEVSFTCLVVPLKED